MGHNDNQNVTLLKEAWFRNLEVAEIDEDLMGKIASHKKWDREVMEVIREGKEEWMEKDGLVTWKGRIYVPLSPSLRTEIIKLNHDHPLARHPGRDKTKELVGHDYWWLRMRTDILKYVEGCDKCQRVNTHRKKASNPLNPNEIPIRPWQIISVDIIGELPESQGFNAIFVIVDCFSKQIHAIPINMSLTAEGYARIFRDHVFKLHGIPEKVISDRGPQFVSKFIQSLYQMLEVTGNPSTAWHPQTDGQTERVNQEIERYLQIYINHHQTDWAEWLSIAEFSYNDKIHSSTKQSPFFVNHGQHPRKGVNTSKFVKNDSAEDFTTRMKKVHEETEKALETAAVDMKKFYDHKRGPSKQYSKGDKVWLEATNIRTDRPMKKLDDKRYGPFEIKKKVGAGAYELKLPKSWRPIHPVFNEFLLSPFKAPTNPSQQKPLPPPPEIIDQIPEYEVEEVVDS